MKLNKKEKSWVLYDVANSAFTLIITVTIPIYFRSLAEGSNIAAEHVTSIFATTTSIAILILALISPVLGAIADYKDTKKKLFIFFLLFGVLGALALAITTTWQAYLFVYVLARIGYAACNVFYDSMLVDVCSENEDRMDTVSSHGYAWGYIGSCIPFIIGIVLIFFAENFGLTTALATRISFGVTALWWLLLSIPLLKNVKQVHYYSEAKKGEKLIRNSFKRVFETLKKIKQNPKILYYIIGYFCYIDGVYTIISMSTTYGGEVGISDTGMILALLVTQFVAFPFAILAGVLARKYDVLKILRVYIVMYMAICVVGFFLTTQLQFWILAIMVGMAQGGIQSLSRSYFGKIIPKNEVNEYFGFFDIFGKFADFFGPLIMAASALLLGKSNYGVLALIILFAIGFVLLGKVQKIEATEKKNI